MNEATDTYTFAKLLRDAVDGRLADVRVSMPGEIVLYDATRQQAQVQPHPRRRYRSGDVVDLPILHRVPVVFPRGGDFSMSWPLRPGDGVLLVVADRSLDQWKDGGGVYDTKDSRKCYLADAVAIPGLVPASDAVEVDETAVVIKHGVLDFRLRSDGSFTLTNTATGVEFFSQLLAVLDNFVQNTNVATQMGLQPFIPAPTYTVERAKLDAFTGGA